MAASVLRLQCMITLLFVVVVGQSSVEARDPSAIVKNWRKLLPDREEHPERLIPSGPSDPKQYKNAISQAACRREFGIGVPAAPSGNHQLQREVPTGPEDPFQRLKDFVACWKSAVGGPHHQVLTHRPETISVPVAAAPSASSESILPPPPVLDTAAAAASSPPKSSLPSSASAPAPSKSYLLSPPIDASKQLETIQPERQVPSGADPIHHKSFTP